MGSILTTRLYLIFDPCKLLIVCVNYYDSEDADACLSQDRQLLCHTFIDGENESGGTSFVLFAYSLLYSLSQ